MTHAKKPIKIRLFKAMFHHKLPVLYMKITLVFSSQDTATKYSEIRKSEREMQITWKYINIHQQKTECI